MAALELVDAVGDFKQAFQLNPSLESSFGAESREAKHRLAELQP